MSLTRGNDDNKHRLSKVERELAALKRLILSETKDSWQRTFSMFSEDREFEEILRRGREIRRGERDEESG